MTHGQPLLERRILQRLRIVRCLVMLGAAFATRSVMSDEVAAEFTVTRPLPYQVVQREDFQPRNAHEHAPGGPQLGFAQVDVVVDLGSAATSISGTMAEHRIVKLPDAYGAEADWTLVAGAQQGSNWSAKVRVPAGGWYRLELRWRREERTVRTAAVEPVGVGEVFVIAGQSYAAGANDELLTVDDPQGRVVAFDCATKQWRPANDPQPGVGDGGTIWPPLGNLLLPVARVPIGFVNVAVGGSATREWLPGQPHYEQLAATGKDLGRFRAVLWQQGESDVIEHRSTEYYVDNLTKIRAALAETWGFAPPWLMAKSTLHPTVYNDPDGEGRIRAAIDTLTTMPGFRPGPDTDILGGENRGPIGTRRHFSGLGQRRAGALWFAAIWAELYRQD